jgi:putative endonuclease
MFTTYVIRSRSTGRLYTGSTSDMEQRLEQHNAGLTRSTRNRGPWDLVYKEEAQTRAEAVARERFFKTGAGREELKRRIQARP